MKQAWERGTFWFSLALTSPTGLFAIFYKQIQPILTEKCSDHEDFHEVIDILRRKVSDRKDYDERLRKAFEDVDEDNNNKTEDS